jgi:DNA-binding transcriptional ArsR family regulator
MSNRHTDGGTNERAWRVATLGGDDSTARAVETLVDATATATEEESFSVDTLFEMLAHPGRRYVLSYLLQSEGFVACAELVDHVAERTDHTMTDEEFRRRVAAELTHSHLPKLEEVGLVDYNMERQVVSTTDLTPVVRPYLRLALAHQRVAAADG